MHTHTRTQVSSVSADLEADLDAWGESTVGDGWGDGGGGLAGGDGWGDTEIGEGAKEEDSDDGFGGDSGGDILAAFNKSLPPLTAKPVVASKRAVVPSVKPKAVVARPAVRASITKRATPTKGKVDDWEDFLK